MCAHVKGPNPVQPVLPALVATSVLHLPPPSKIGTPCGPQRAGSRQGIGYLEQGRLEALPVHEAPGRGVRGRRVAPQGQVVMVVAVAVVTQR